MVMQTSEASDQNQKSALKTAKGGAHSHLNLPYMRGRLGSACWYQGPWQPLTLITGSIGASYSSSSVSLPLPVTFASSSAAASVLTTRHNYIHIHAARPHVLNTKVRYETSTSSKWGRRKAAAGGWPG
jgi:hypothetical protein